MRLSHNEDCPCGSGNTYGSCCKNKVIVPSAKSQKPPEVQIMEMMKASMKKCCMHPDQQHCKGKIKGAHALQNNKIISLLAGDDRHVYMLAPKRKPLIFGVNNSAHEVIVEISRTSANDATTETCFCDLHDNIAFAVIEKGAPDFVETNDEMKFVYAYKAFIFEYYKQQMTMDIFKSNFKRKPAVFNTIMMVRYYRMLQLKMSEFEIVKKHFDGEILSKMHRGIETCVIKLPEQIKFAVYAYIAPDFDLEGKKIKHTIKGTMHRLSVTAFPEKNQSYILLSCLKSEKFIYETFFSQLQKASADRIKFYFSMILPLYSENMVLSSDLWNSWNEEIKMAYTFYANLNGSDFSIYNRTIGMVIRNAARSKNEVDYSNRGKIDLFPI